MAAFGRLTAARAVPRLLPGQRPRSSSGVKTTRASATRRPPPPALRYTAPTSAEALTADIGTFLNARVRSGNWGAMIVSLTRGDTLFSANAGDLMLPASTMKLFTAALAFDTFGPEHQFTTAVLRDGAVGADGTLSGNLVLRGGGDPGLSTRYYKAPAEGPMASLARMVAASGIKRVNGDLIADASAFESKRVPEGWLARYLESGYAARVSALSMNENLATVVITPQTSGAATVTLDPPSSTVPVINNMRTVAGSKAAKLSIRRLARRTYRRARVDRLQGRLAILPGRDRRSRHHGSRECCGRRSLRRE